MNNLPKDVTQRCLEQDLNPRPTDRKSNAIPVALSRHLTQDESDIISSYHMSTPAMMSDKLYDMNVTYSGITFLVI